MDFYVVAGVSVVGVVAALEQDNIMAGEIYHNELI